MSYSLGLWQAMLATVYVADKVRMGVHEFVPTSQVAHDLDIPAPSLSRLMRSLNHAGIIETREGAGGGVRLAAQADQVTLLDLLEAIEQKLPLFRTDAEPRVQGETPALRQAALKGALADAETAMRTSLGEVTVADISK